MQHSVLDVLLYLFDYLVYGNEKQQPDMVEMRQQLVDAGFDVADINRSMEWLLDLTDIEKRSLATSTQSIRLYTRAEEDKISTESRGFLLKLGRLGVIDGALREVIIQKLMVLDEETILLDDLKWVVLMAIFNQPGREEDSVWLEQLITDNQQQLRVN